MAGKPGRFQRGFTLIELLIIIAIIGILVSIVMPKLKRTPTPQPPKEAKPVEAVKGPWPPIDNAVAPTQAEAMLRKNYYVILDGSGSMRDQGCSGDVSKFASAVGALNDFFAGVPPDANVGLLIFDEIGFSERVPLGTGNRAQLQSQLGLARPGGGTPLSSAIEQGYKSLTRQASQQLGYGEYHMVVVTDGEASKGYDPTPFVNSILDDTAIVIRTLGYCIGTGHSLNQPGRTLYSAVDDAQSLTRELRAVLAEAETFDVSQFK
jgi:prepilin-type N-terminal cleavage/methylation domain-containing protein